MQPGPNLCNWKIRAIPIGILDKYVITITPMIFPILPVSSSWGGDHSFKINHQRQQKQEKVSHSNIGQFLTENTKYLACLPFVCFFLRNLLYFLIVGPGYGDICEFGCYKFDQNTCNVHPLRNIPLVSYVTAIFFLFRFAFNA